MSDPALSENERLSPHYRLPAGYLFVPQVDFWEIVCYRADVEDGLFKLRHRDMMDLFSPPAFARAKREALGGQSPPLVALKEEGEQFYVLRAQAQGWPDETLRKLRAYIERGWIVQLGRQRHAKWVLNYLLLECQRRKEKIKAIQKRPPATVAQFSLSWTKLKKALETAKGKKVEYRKLKDGFLLLERLGIVTPLTGRPTARLGYGQRFQHRLNAGRLLDIAPSFLRRCRPLGDGSPDQAQAVRHLLHILAGDYRRQGKARTWTLERLHGEVKVDLEIEHHHRVAVQRELIWVAAGVLARAGILRAERSGYALTPRAVERIGDPTHLETGALAVLAQVQAEQTEGAALSFAEVARLDEILAPCRQRDAGQADLARAIVCQMNYPVEIALPLFALLRRRMDRLPEKQFPALLAYFKNRQSKARSSLHPEDILNDFCPRRRGRRDKIVTVRKTLKGRRPIVEGQLELAMDMGKIHRARLCCTLRHGRPLPPELAGQPLDICLRAGDGELYRTTLPLLDIPDDPLAPADITGPLRALNESPRLTLRLTLPAPLPALRLLARIEAVMQKT